MSAEVRNHIKGVAKSPHSVIELSVSEYKHYIHNAIVLSGLSKVNCAVTKTCIPSYDVVHYGKHVKQGSVAFKIGNREEEKINRIDMSRMAKKYMLILGRKDEISNVFDNVMIFQSNMKQVGVGVKAHEQNGSGFVVLLFALLNDVGKEDTTIWTNENVDDVKACKKNICTGRSSHFESKGYYASFGMKANYGIVNKSSLAEYAVKKTKCEYKQHVIKQKATEIEMLCALEFKKSTASFGRYLRNITELLSPVVDEAYACQDDWGNIGLVKVPSSQCGFWMSQVCIDASTSTAHTENDCTYTFISVPAQENVFSKKVKKKSYFLFGLNEVDKVCIPLNQQLSFFFSGLCLLHRQNHPSQDKHSTNFVNIAAYGNERLFNHIRASFNRLKSE